eukprot:RCo007489
MSSRHQHRHHAPTIAKGSSGVMPADSCDGMELSEAQRMTEKLIRRERPSLNLAELVSSQPSEQKPRTSGAAAAAADGDSKDSKRKGEPTTPTAGVPPVRIPLAPRGQAVVPLRPS